MKYPLSDTRITQTQPLITPAVLADELPVTDPLASLVYSSRKTIASILKGEDPRFIAITGPCSIHDIEAAIDYASRLQEIASEISDAIFTVMRVYFEKPRTTVGWKGLINDPDLNGSFHINKGLRLARKLLLDITGIGVPVANEFLDTTFGQYYAELVSFGSIGARTVESQIHRELASGLSMPVGIKNRTDGNVDVAVDALLAAGSPHWFPSLTAVGAPAILATTGNEDTCLILRGGKDTGPNFDHGNVTRIGKKLKGAGLRRPIVIDCSHGNSSGEPARQKKVLDSVIRQLESGTTAIKGVMIESNIVGGGQKLGGSGPLVYGQSITDACISISETGQMLRQLADCVRQSL